MIAMNDGMVVSESRVSLRCLDALLRELSGVIEALGDAQYAQKPVGVYTSSIGGHVRHCLDHVRSLVEAAETEAMDYDHRARGTAVENSRAAALATLDELLAALRELDPGALERRVALTAIVSPDAPAVTVETTIGREAIFVLSHTIHHNAIIGAMVKTLGGWLPERFGYAPATVAHARQTERR
jgi:uncharacterized damage-inducible protein DinB